MAFEFFRQRQKMVIIIMVVLMVSFLISFQGCEMLLERNQAKQVVATSNAGPVTFADMNQAGSDVDILRHLQLDNPMLLGQLPSVEEFMHLTMGNAGDAQLAYALLLKEARAAGVQAGKADADQLLKNLEDLGLDEQTLRSRLPENVHWSRDNYRDSLTRWLTIHRMFASSVPKAPVSEPQVRQTFADLSEQMNVRLVKFDAGDFVNQVPEPTEDQIATQYQALRTRPPGAFKSLSDFGFGYRQPARVKIAYLLVRREPLQRAAQPTEDAILTRYMQQEPTFPSPTTQATQASQPAESTAAGAFRQDMLQRIEADLTREAVDPIMISILAAAREAMPKAPATGPATQPTQAAQDNPFAAIRAKLVGPADRYLSKSVTVNIQSKPLSEAIGTLAKAAGLKAIVYPWGQSNKLSIAADVKVTLQAKDMPLKDALAQITQQVLSTPATATAPAPKVSAQQAQQAFNWVAFGPTPDVIYATAGSEDVDMLPIQTGQTDLMTQKELAQDRVLAAAQTSPAGAGRSLGETAFNSRAILGAQAREAFPLEQGELAPPMYVTGGDPGRLLWQIQVAQPPAEPTQQQMHDPAIRSQIVRDLKLQAAFELARQKAQAFAQTAQGGFDQAAKKADLNVQQTGMFSRRTASQPWRAAAMQYLKTMPYQQAIMLAQLAAPIALDWTPVPNLTMPSDASQRDLNVAIFKLAPTNATTQPTDTQPGDIQVQPLPPTQEVAVVQVIGYEPAREDSYEQTRLPLTSDLNRLRTWEFLTNWYSVPGIKQRTGFVQQ